MIKKVFLFLLAIFIASFCFGQNEKRIKVYFLYGSRPAPGHQHQESRLFGGIHGGHVSIGFDTAIVGFGPLNGFHIFAHRKKLKGVFKWEGIHGFRTDSTGSKYTAFEIPVSDSQYVKLKQVANEYLFVKTPYDYAFFGMRCASASYDILSQIGLVQKKSQLGNILSNFYPKKVRNKMFKLAKEKKYKVTCQNGRKSRIWEQD